MHDGSEVQNGDTSIRGAADFVLQNAAQSLHGQRIGQISHDHGSGTVSGDGEDGDAGII